MAATVSNDPKDYEDIPVTDPRHAACHDCPGDQQAMFATSIPGIFECLWCGEQTRCIRWRASGDTVWISAYGCNCHKKRMIH